MYSLGWKEYVCIVLLTSLHERKFCLLWNSYFIPLNYKMDWFLAPINKKKNIFVHNKFGYYWRLLLQLNVNLSWLWNLYLGSLYQCHFIVTFFLLCCWTYAYYLNYQLEVIFVAHLQLSFYCHLNTYTKIINILIYN